MVPKAVTESVTSHLYKDVKKTVNETLSSHTENKSIRSNVWNKTIDLHLTMNDDTESEDTYLKQVEEKKWSASIPSWLDSNPIFFSAALLEVLPAKFCKACSHKKILKYSERQKDKIVFRKRFNLIDQ